MNFVEKIQIFSLVLLIFGFKYNFNAISTNFRPFLASLMILRWLWHHREIDPPPGEFLKRSRRVIGHWNWSNGFWAIYFSFSYLNGISRSVSPFWRVEHSLALRQRRLIETITTGKKRQNPKPETRNPKRFHSSRTSDGLRHSL